MKERDGSGNGLFGARTVYNWKGLEELGRAAKFVTIQQKERVANKIGFWTRVPPRNSEDLSHLTLVGASIFHYSKPSLHQLNVFRDNPLERIAETSVFAPFHHRYLQWNTSPKFYQKSQKIRAMTYCNHPHPATTRCKFSSTLEHMFLTPLSSTQS